MESSFPGSAEKEIHFWKELSMKLGDTKAKLESAPVLLTKLVLKRSNRVSDQLIREVELELDKCIDVVQISVTFLRDFPLEELRAATALHPQLTRALASSLQHFSKLRHSKYDLSRASRLIESLGAMMAEKVVGILREKNEKNLMLCPLGEFKRLKEGNK